MPRRRGGARSPGHPQLWEETAGREDLAAPYLPTQEHRAQGWVTLHAPTAALLTHAERESVESCPQHGAGTPHAGITATLHKLLLCHPSCHAQHDVEEEGELRREGTAATLLLWVLPSHPSLAVWGQTGPTEMLNSSTPGLRGPVPHRGAVTWMGGAPESSPM